MVVAREYEVGDTIKIREDLQEAGERGDFEGRCGYNPDMAVYAGTTLTVASVHCRGNDYIYYRTVEDEGEWSWSDVMLDYGSVEKYVPKEERNMDHTAIERVNRKNLADEIFETLELCEIYSPSDEGVGKILDEWEEKKGRADVWNGNSVIDILSKHPDYIPEKGYIVKKNEYDRGVDVKVIQDVLSSIEYITEHPAEVLVSPVEIRPWSYEECRTYKEKLSGVLETMSYDTENLRWKGMTYDEVYKEREIWRERINILHETYKVVGYTCYKHEDFEEAKKVHDLIRDIHRWFNTTVENIGEEELLQPLFIDKRVTEMVENSNLNIRGIREGQKFNKVIGKILAETKIKDKWGRYNKEFSRLSDAASPTKFTRFTIISANPVDFYRMSFGSSWSSCQTIDKEGHYRPSDGGDSYEGMHASGTSSYMCDPSTVIMYTVDKEYEGSDYEMQPKINRCLFHLGEGKFVMGRVYPQGTDGEEEVYRQWRNIFQQIIAECMGLPNYWKTLKGVGEKLNQIQSEGTHYRDYEYGYCNIAGWSYIKPTAETIPSDRVIIIGSQPICPSCGRKHWEEDSIECDCCRGYGHTCYSCGCVHDEDNMHYIDGEWYCEDCCFYCEYHEEWEIGEQFHISNYGYVCEYALETGDFNECEYCGSTYYVGYCDDGINTEDGRWFCDSCCAESAGYVMCDDNLWYSEDETHYCEACGRTVPYEDWNEELGMCTECAENNTDANDEENIA